MILKPFDLTPPPAGDLRREAGHAAERQMAFYLQRDFAKDPHLFVLNNLRIVDPEQPEFDGTPGVCQIDHLVMHRWGVFIVESKSVTDEVSIRDDGHGGDEWTRRFRGREQGFESPIQQARRQGGVPSRTAQPTPRITAESRAGRPPHSEEGACGH